MAKQSNDLRERLLAALPQPESLANYREETAALLAKHARALRWDKVLANTVVFLAIALLLLSSNDYWRLGASTLHGLQIGSAALYFVGLIFQIRYKIYDSQVATLKEIKQVQLQVLELQASLRKEQ
jgi:p-aminobenzoyl-glutamate transporter AbgT